MKQTEDTRQQGTWLIIAGLAAVFTALLLIAVKLVAWLMTGSVSLLASLIDSVMDSLASLVNLLAIRYSLLPADAEHRFGHGKAEALAGLGQSLVIGLSACYLFYQSFLRLLQPERLSDTLVGISVMVFAIIVTAGLVVLQRYVIRRTGSTAIRADSLHYVTDLTVNLSVILALVAAAMGYYWVDAVVGLAIAFYILKAAWHIGYEAAQLLLDREVSAEVRQQIMAMVLQQPGILGCHDLRTRQSGRTCFVQMHLDMDENLSLKESHALADAMEAAIRQRFPQAEVIIHQDPVRPAAQDQWKDPG